MWAVDWERTAEKNGLGFHDFPTGDRYGRNESTMQMKKYVRFYDGIPTTVALTTVLVTIRGVTAHIDRASSRQEYDEYRDQNSDRGETEHVRASQWFDLHALLEKDLLWSNAGDTESFTDEAQLATCLLLSDVGHEMPVSRNEYIELLQFFA